MTAVLRWCATATAGDQLPPLEAVVTSLLVNPVKTL